MTSKISYFKFIEADIRHRGWLAILTAAALFFTMPLHLLLVLDRVKQGYSYAAGSEELQEWAAHYLPGSLNGIFFTFLGFLIAVIAVFCAVTGFAYLHSREKQDFYHGMPISRTQWFAISYTGGLLIFLVPYLVFGFCTILIAGTNISISAGLLGSCITALLGGILGFLIIYHTAILAMFMTGKTITGVLAALVLTVYGSIIPTLFSGLEKYFYASWSDNTPELLQRAETFCSPAALFIQTLISTASRGIDGSLTSGVLPGILTGLIAALVLLAVSLLLCRHFPSEAAGNSLAFPKAAPFIKFLIAVPTALFIGLIVKFFNNSVSVNWIVIFSILSVILLCLVIEFIYHQDLTRLLSGKISTALSVGVVLIIVCILKFDLFGYDTYLPKEAKIESMSVYSDQFSGYFTYPQAYQSVVFNRLNEDAFTVTDYAPLRELAEEGIQNLKQGITPEQVILNDSSYGYLSITLHYQLHSGKNVYRKYAVSRDGALQALTRLCEDENFRKTLFPIFYLDKKAVQKISIEDIYYQPVALTLNREQQNRLLEAYEKDVLAASVPDMQYESPLGEMILSVEDPNMTQSVNGNESNLSQIGQFYIYDSYENTLALLKDYGYTLRTEIHPEDVMFMTYYPNENSEEDNYARQEIKDYDFGAGISITEPEEVKELLGRITYDQCNGLFGSRIVAVGSVEITLTNKAYPSSYAVIR